ncbi:MAG TPA: ATP-binding protein, partial [Hyphomicrobiaceae bacterium]|nr:ATP-binding protein [Hyphomicrobiaceae bacterium]
MTSVQPRLSLDGMLDLIPKSRRPLAPIFEAVSNALEAIAERRNRGWSGQGEITLKLYFTGLLPETRSLERIEIIDNGIGFDDANYARFETFLDRTKGYNNRGSGRVQFLHFARRIEVTSHFLAEGKPFRRHFLCNPSTYITEPSVTPIDTGVPLGTTIDFRDFDLTDEAREYFDSLTIAELRNALKSHFLLRLHLARVENPEQAPVLHLQFLKNSQPDGIPISLTPADIPTPETGQIDVPYVKIRDPRAEDVEWVPPPAHVETLHWAHFKLAEDELPENGVMLCSKGVQVDRVRFDGLRKAEAVEGHRFVTAIHGDVLNRAGSVSHTVDRFTLPNRADTEKAIHDGALFFDPKADILFFDDIEEAVENALPSIYADLFTRKAEQQADIEAIAKAHGIPPEIARATKIRLTDSEEQITEKLFRKQAETLAEQSLRIKRLFEALDQLDPSSETYQTDLEARSNELLELIPEQNKQELSRYVIRRQMVATVLGKILDGHIAPVAKPKASKSSKRRLQGREALIHDLIIRRGTSTSQPHDLWVLSEEFVHFEGCSNVSIDQIKDSHGQKLLRPISKADIEAYGIRKAVKPDIFLFADEGQCILIELKAPDENISEYLNQLPMYCNLIANFAVKPITRFYCYLVGETLSPIEIGGDYRQTVDGDFVRRADYAIMRYENGRQDQEIGKAHIEIIKLSSLRHRALRRNKSFADRLGI